MRPQTVRGKILLGWMPRHEALKVLTKLCDFDEPLSEEGASRLWEQYRDKVAALPVRNCGRATTYGMTLAENLEIKRFLKRHRKHGAKNIVRVAKYDPRGLVVHQFQLALHRAEMHKEAMPDPRARTRICLGIGLEEQVQRMRNQSGAVILELPHAEFFVNFLPNGQFQLAEAARFVSVAELGDRTLLWAGYHRAYAVASQTVPDETERVLLATLIRGDADRFLGPDSDRPEVRDTVRGVRAPFLRDFFDDDLCMSVNLRKQRPELHIHPHSAKTEVIWVDEY